MRTAAALLLLTGLAGCWKDSVVQPRPLPPDGAIAVDLRTDQAQYRMGASATSTMVNHSTDPITMGICGDVLEKDTGAGWVEMPTPKVACPQLALLLSAGDSITVALDLTPASSPGTYRLRRLFTVVRGSSGEAMYRRSNPFGVSR